MGNDLLKSSALKNTKRRQAILAVLQKSDVPLTAEEIHGRAVQDIHVNISTIYRALATLTENGILLKNLSQDGKTYYQINSHQHKHHLLCTLCGEIIPVDACPLEALEAHLEETTGYLITGHNLEFLGICPACAEK